MLNTLLLNTAHKKLKKIIKIYLLLFKRFFFLLSLKRGKCEKCKMKLNIIRNQSKTAGKQIS